MNVFERERESEKRAGKLWNPLPEYNFHKHTQFQYALLFAHIMASLLYFPNTKSQTNTLHNTRLCVNGMAKCTQYRAGGGERDMYTRKVVIVHLGSQKLRKKKIYQAHTHVWKREREREKHKHSRRLYIYLNLYSIWS